MNLLNKANRYINENKEKVGDRPIYHLTPEIGWLNDPNGFCQFKGKYHLYYQTYPYDIVWNDMHWGHVSSDDMIKWNYEGIVMANDTPADISGAFSGSAIEIDEELYFMYTGHQNNDGVVVQEQCLAKSKDGYTLEKVAENPTISKDELPSGYLAEDFRDPKVWKKDGIYYTVLVAKNSDERGEVLLYKSTNMINWEFVSSIYQSKYEENRMLECPDFFHLDGKDVLLYSVMPCNRDFDGKTKNVIEYHIGSLDYEAGTFKSEYQGCLDYGDNFYAPQSMIDSKGRRVLISWMRTDGKIELLEKLKWNGMMTIVRELKIIDGKLAQLALDELDKYLNLEIEIKEKVVNTKVELYKRDISAKKISFTLESQSELTELNIFDDTRFIFEGKAITYSSASKNRIKTVTVDEALLQENKTTEFEIYIDKYSIEMLVNKGTYSFTYTDFNIDKNILLAINSENAIVRDFKVHNILV